MGRRPAGVSLCRGMRLLVLHGRDTVQYGMILYIVCSLIQCTVLSRPVLYHDSDNTKILGIEFVHRLGRLTIAIAVAVPVARKYERA